MTYLGRMERSSVGCGRLFLNIRVQLYLTVTLVKVDITGTDPGTSEDSFSTYGQSALNLSSYLREGEGVLCLNNKRLSAESTVLPGDQELC